MAETAARAQHWVVWRAGGKAKEERVRMQRARWRVRLQTAAREWWWEVEGTMRDDRTVVIVRMRSREELAGVGVGIVFCLWFLACCEGVIICVEELA